MSGVELQGVVKGWGGNTVVKGVDLSVRPGERFTLLGPSGCGKTTILRMVAGLETPDAGTIDIGGARVAGDGRFVPPEARGLGMVFQSYAVWPHRTVRDNVAYPLRLRGVADADAQADAALAKVKLGAMGDRMPGTLSGGQQQRVAVARALAARPRVLLLDEPLSNLDAALREELGAEIAEIARDSGLTVIMVTHDQAEALALSDRVGVMHGGVLQQVGTPEALYAAPVNLRVARCTGPLGELPALRAGGRVRVGGVDLGESTGPDGAVTLAFRPEEARFVERGGLPCTVLGRLYRGATARWRVRVDTGATPAELVLDAPADAPAHAGLAFTRTRVLED
jgi:iron(III) transport system ATP-binding protein